MGMAFRTTAWLLVVGAACAAQGLPPVQNIRFDSISHSTVRVIYSVSGGFTNWRTRYIASSAGTCTDGVTGALQLSSSLSTHNPNGVILSGLSPATTYQVCPEISTDGGQTWSHGAGASFQTKPLPAVHPARPIPPEQFSTNYPDTTGYAVVTTKADCGDFPDLLRAAVQAQDKEGTVVQIPPGTVCGAGKYSFESAS